MLHILRPIMLLAALLLAPVAAEARWLEARSSNFIVYSDGGEDDLRQSVALLEDFDRLLRTLTGTSAPPRGPLKVYLVRSVDRLREVSAVPAAALGFYAARVGGTAAFAVRGDRPGLGGEEVLLHEYAHHFMARYYPAYYPSWYSEGFAEYMMTARFGGERIEIGRVNPGRAITLLRGTWLPVDTILSGSIGGMSSAQAGQYYAESWLIVHYIFASAERRESLSRYLADLHRDIAEPDAFRAAFGVDHAAFETNLKRYMNGRLGSFVIERPAAPPTESTVRALPEAADDLLLPYAALTLGIADPGREAATIAAIRTASARYPDDAFARKVLARAEINSGDRQAGVAMVDRLIAQYPDDAELLYLRGVADFYTGRKDAAVRADSFAAARPWFARAVALDPGYYTALYRLVQCTPPEQGRMSDEALAHLLAAQQLAPLVGDIAVDAATALMTRQRPAEAASVLMPIASNPHGGHSQQARALLATAQSSATD